MSSTTKKLRPPKSALILALLYVANLPALEAAVSDIPLIAAHRGTTVSAPENTLAAIRWASDYGADLVETDLRVSSDGVLVLMHDAQVDRTTNGIGRVRDLTLDELRVLDAGAGERVPTLDEVMVLLSDRPQRLLLDVKTDEDGLAARLVETVVSHRYEQRVLVGVRSIDQLQEIRTLDPRIKMLAMPSKPVEVRDFLRHRPDGVRLWARWAQSDPGLARVVRDAGAAVWITSGDRRPTQLRELFGLADGFITDVPVAFRQFAEDTRSRLRP